MDISTKEQAYKHIADIKENMRKTKSSILEILKEKDEINSLLDIKVNKVAYDPISGEPSNFIEVLNQSFSDLVIFYAVLRLLEMYPDTQFKLCLGAQSGTDIKSADEMIVAECFAATSINSNDKINEDAKKLLKLPDSNSKKKYIFFYSLDKDEIIEKKRECYPDIDIKRIGDFI